MLNWFFKSAIEDFEGAGEPGSTRGLRIGLVDGLAGDEAFTLISCFLMSFKVHVVSLIVTGVGFGIERKS